MDFVSRLFFAMTALKMTNKSFTRFFEKNRVKLFNFGFWHYYYNKTVRCRNYPSATGCFYDY